VAPHDIPLHPIIGEPELTVSWLAQRGMRPGKTEWGRYTIEETRPRSELSLGAKLLIVENLGIRNDETLNDRREEIESHPRWPGAD
jgi:hypothetical protein